jgi:hypothetical protein
LVKSTFIKAKTPLMYKISEDREDLCSEFFNSQNKELQDKDIDLRAVTRQRIAGIYYMVHFNSCFAQCARKEIW